MILLVDDNDDVLEAAAEFLRVRSCAVRTARSISDGRRILDVEAIDMLVTDFELGPEGDGDELLDYAATRFPRILRVVFSASAVPSHVRAHVIVAKPDLQALVDAISAFGHVALPEVP